MSENIVATFVEFEVDLIKLSTRVGMAIAKAKEKMQRKNPKPTEKQQKELHMAHETGDHAVSDLTEIFLFQEQLSIGHSERPEV